VQHHHRTDRVDPQRVSQMLTWVVLLIIAVLLIVPEIAEAADAGTADPKPPGSFVLPTDQLWAAAAGSVAPLLTYLINTYAPWTAEWLKSFVMALGGAVAAGVTQAITAGDVGFNETTLQFIATGAFAALIFHVNLWTRNGVAQRLGSGENRNLARRERE
jgi:hypothetical protein